jgi:hypothetical protein
VQEGLEGILSFPVLGNLSNNEWGMGILSYPIRGKLLQSKTYDLGLTFVKACTDLLFLHYGSVIVLGQHGNMELF